MITYSIKYIGTEKANNSTSYGDSEELIDLVLEKKKIAECFSKIHEDFTKAMELINAQRPNKRLEGKLTINAELKDENYDVGGDE
jgi:hypothetical protein